MTGLPRWIKLVLTFLDWMWWGVVKPMGTPLKGLRETLREVPK